MCWHKHWATARPCKAPHLCQTCGQHLVPQQSTCCGHDFQLRRPMRRCHFPQIRSQRPASSWQAGRHRHRRTACCSDLTVDGQVITSLGAWRKLLQTLHANNVAMVQPQEVPWCQDKGMTLLDVRTEKQYVKGVPQPCSNETQNVLRCSGRQQAVSCVVCRHRCRVLCQACVLCCTVHARKLYLIVQQ